MLKVLKVLICLTLINWIQCLNDATHWDTIDEISMDNVDDLRLELMAVRALAVFNGRDRCRAAFDRIHYAGIQSASNRRRFSLGFTAYYRGLTVIECLAIVEIPNDEAHPVFDIIKIECPARNINWDGILPQSLQASL